MGMAMPEHCKMMMQMHQKMEGSNKAQDAKLKGLMSAMDRASGDQKMKAMAAVISELVAQRSGRQNRAHPSPIAEAQETQGGPPTGCRGYMPGGWPPWPKGPGPGR